MISVFDMFKVGIGPSSSHTVGPMKASKQFIDDLVAANLLSTVSRVQVDVYGSLSLTGRGHNTDVAILLGLMGYLPDNVDVEAIDALVEKVKTQNELTLAQATPELARTLPFDFMGDMPFHYEFLPKHENGMTLSAFENDRLLLTKTYYSIGGGFIVEESQFGQVEESSQKVPFPYQYAADMLKHCKAQGLPISSIMLKNEQTFRDKAEVQAYLQHIWQVMDACIQRGLHTEGLLPGPLKVVRRASSLRRSLEASSKLNSDPMQIIDWVNMFALAVNEENAAGGRVVTAPTNGACGIVPAVFAYYRHFIAEPTAETIERYLLSTSFIGSLYKMNASISGAEVGCQGEVGVACSMAAAGLTEIMGGTPEQVCVAAEIAMEHNLGLTCDPVGGQVQVPCIERNAIASVKAINASRMALKSTTAPRVSLDKVVETMFETGRDMNAKYRETSTGGLAIKVVPCE